LAVAQQLTRAGHDVVVLERADRIGGLLRYGIPEFKMEKRHIDRRIAQMETEGTEFRTNAVVGESVDMEVLRASHDAVVMACGATKWRDLPIPGRELSGIHQAMEYLPESNRVQFGDFETSPIDVSDKHVVIIGGGDTGADCLGTAHRQGAASVTQLEIMPMPPEARAGERNPWPQFAMVYKVTSAHEEGGERMYSVNTEQFVDDGAGHVKALKLHEVEMIDGKFTKIEGTDQEIPADFVFLALGFVGPEGGTWLDELGVEYDQRGNVVRDDNYMTNQHGLFVAGDMGRGQSLIVWAIAEGRAAAAGVDEYLMGITRLPKPVLPTERPLM
jgi:glutamate synthase (NADPH/NADH) small chain